MDIDQKTHRHNLGGPLQSPVLLVAWIVAGIRGDGRQLPAVPDLPQPDLLAQLVRVHDHREDVHPVVGHRCSGAPRDAVALRDDLRLARRYDVPPVRVDADAQHAGVVGAQLVGVVELEARVVDDEVVELGIGVVGLQHVEARPGVGVQRVAGLGGIIEALRKRQRRFDVVLFWPLFYMATLVVSLSPLDFSGQVRARSNYRYCIHAVWLLPPPLPRSPSDLWLD